MRTCHEEDYRTIAPAVPGSNKDSQNQTTLTSYVANAQPYPQTSTRFKTCEDSLLTLICKDMLPLSLVDSPNFKEFVSILDKRYKPSSHTHFTRVLLPQKYDLVKQLVKKKLVKLHNEAEHCAFTTDLWTGCHNRGYLSLTVHFIDSRMELNHYCLMTKEVSESHTADVIASVLSESFQEWELREPEQVYAFCTDNGKNIVNAIINHLKVLHLPCIGHTLQLSVQKSFSIDRVARVLAKVRKLVEHFKKSSKSTNEFRSKQALLDLLRHKLVQQVDTRWGPWGSVYNMLERVVEQQPALCAVLLGSSDRVHRSYLPEGDECTLIEELLVILKPFVQATTYMSVSSYPTIGIVYPLLYKLLHMTLSVTDDDSTIAKKAKLAIFGDLNSRYAQEDLVLLLKKCAYLDPRFKDLNPFVPLQERQDVIEAVKCDLIQLIEKRSKHEVEESGTSEPNPVDPPKSKKPKVASLLFSDFSNCKDSAEASSVMDLVQSELRRYNEEDLLEYDNDPMDWWDTQESLPYSS